MTLALLCGAGMGLALLLLGLAVAPARTDLAAAVGRWESQRHYRPTLAAGAARSDPRVRLGGFLVSELRQLDITMTKMRMDLELVGKTLEEHLAGKVLLAAFGLILPSLLSAVLILAGITLPWSVSGLFGLCLAAVFFVLPDVAVAQAARRRRDELRRALSCYLDLVSMSLAGGRGIPEALPTAAQIGRGWAFELIAETISRARYEGTTPWEAFANLGERVDLPELRDLGGALTLVADDGAKVRDSLSARAATQRRRQLAEAEGEAEKGDQSIGIAQVVLAIGFLLFLAYPAVINVLVL
ncbi:type II secretion system F family protein [Aeromicrobium panaciterrae]